MEHKKRDCWWTNKHKKDDAEAKPKEENKPAKVERKK